MIKLLKKNGFKMICVVRKEEQRSILDEPNVVITTEKDTHEEDLRKATKEYHATCLLECICGDVTHKVIRAMPKDSKCYTYGHLDSNELTGVDMTDLVLSSKRIKSFAFTNWSAHQGYYYEEWGSEEGSEAADE